MSEEQGIRIGISNDVHIEVLIKEYTENILSYFPNHQRALEVSHTLK